MCYSWTNAGDRLKLKIIHRKIRNEHFQPSTKRYASADALITLTEQKPVHLERVPITIGEYLVVLHFFDFATRIVTSRREVSARYLDDNFYTIRRIR